MLDADAQAAIDAHPLICQPRQKKKRQHIAAPIVNQQPEARKNQNQNRHPMAEAIFAGENVEKFSLENIPAALAFIVAEFAPFAENFFLRHRPRDTGDDHRQNDKRENLHGN